MISVGRKNHARRRDTPPASSVAVRRRMQATRQTGTKAELRLCEALTRLGLHYAIDEVMIPGVPSRADVVFFSARVAVFVDGFFGMNALLTEPRRKATVSGGEQSWQPTCGATCVRLAFSGRLVGLSSEFGNIGRCVRRNVRLGRFPTA